MSETGSSEIKSHTERVSKLYPLERTVPPGADIDPDIAFDHMMKVSFLVDQAALDAQHTFQLAEEYALQQCQLQCKRDGRMQPNPNAKSDLDNDQRERMIKNIEKEIKAGNLNPSQVAQYERSKKFQKELAAIPFADPPKSAEPGEEPALFADKMPRGFGLPERNAAQEAEQRIEAERQNQMNSDLNVDDDDDNDVEDKTETNKDIPALPKTSKVQVLQTEVKDIYEVDEPVVPLSELKPAIPEGLEPKQPTEEQLEKDRLNPKIDLLPVKKRVNKWAYADEFEDKEHLSEQEIKDYLKQKREAETPTYRNENVAGLVADGTEIPIVNEGEMARDLPQVYQEGPKHRDKILQTNYDPKKDRPFLWHKRFKYIVVSAMGPNCPQKAPRNLYRVWGGVKDMNEAKRLVKMINKKNPYAHMWSTYMYSIQRWIALVPKGEDDNGTVVEGNEEYAEYLQSSFDNRKKAAVELEQRALDAKAVEKATTGQTIMEQLRAKNIDPNSLQ